MVKLKRSDMRVIDTAFQSSPGYVLDFSNRTFGEYFEDEFQIEIYDKKYAVNGTSKMDRLRTFCQIEEAFTVSKVLRELWGYSENRLQAMHNDLAVKKNIFELISRIEAVSAIACTDAIERFEFSQTLDELVASIERDISGDNPAATLDRLHTYCTKKFACLLDECGITHNQGEPLHSLVGKYFKVLREKHELHKMTRQIIKNSTHVFEQFNHVRNHKSLAHDNELLTKTEARFIFDSVSALLRFVTSIDTMRCDD